MFINLFDFKFDKGKFPLNWKIFWTTFVTVFFIVILQNIGVRVPRLFNLSDVPKSVSFPKKTDSIDKIKPLLEKNPSSYKLKQSSSLFTNTYAASSSSSYDNLSSYAAIDFESGNVILEKNLSQKIPIASLTKIATAVVALDLAKPEDRFIVSYNASMTSPTRMGVIPNQSLTLRELLNALLLTSANDSAQVIKEGIDQRYGDGAFIKAMNLKAKFLKLKNSHYANPQGFDDSLNYSTSEDLAILSHYALTNYPLISEIVKKDYEFLPENSYHKQFDLYNWNGLLNVYPGILGVKIGNTDQAQNTMVVLSEREGKKILVVVLGAPGVLERDLWASRLLDAGFEKAFGLKPINITEEELQAKYSTWKYWG